MLAYGGRSVLPRKRCDRAVPNCSTVSVEVNCPGCDSGFSDYDSFKYHQCSMISSRSVLPQKRCGQAVPLPDDSNISVEVNCPGCGNGFSDCDSFKYHECTVDVNALQWWHELSHMCNTCNFEVSSTSSVLPADLESTEASTATELSTPPTSPTPLKVPTNDIILRTPSSPFIISSFPWTVLSRGSFSQNVFSGQGPCTAIAAVALAFTKSFGITAFRPKVIDEILWIGALYYRECCRKLGLKSKNLWLTASEVAGRITSALPKLDVIVHVEEDVPVLNGQEVPMVGVFEFKTFSKSFSWFWAPTRTSRFAILTLFGQSIALIRERSCLYLFDSHSRDHVGVTSSFGSACLVSFEDVPKKDLARELFKYLKVNMQGDSVVPKNLKKLTEGELQEFMYAFEIVHVVEL